MVTLDVGDVPDDVHDMPVRTAGRRGQSLQEYLLTVLKSRAAELHESHGKAVTAAGPYRRFAREVVTRGEAVGSGAALPVSLGA